MNNYFQEVPLNVLGRGNIGGQEGIQQKRFFL